jgi:hypothetical protein
VNTSPLLLLGTVLLVLAAIPAVGVLWEVGHVPWNRGPFRKLGRVIFSKAAVIGTVLTFNTIGASLLVFGWGRPLWFEILRTVVFGLIVPVLWAQWAVYRRIRKHGLFADIYQKYPH